MTTTSEAGPGRPNPRVGAVVSETAQLVSLASRLLGSLAAAEDVVQATHGRWYAMPDQQQAAVHSPGEWLTRVVSRICLVLLGSSRARRDRSVGPSIPEPIPAQAAR
jgi:DNA-directed RNA polymerase specialized sigma24 family protein